MTSLVRLYSTYLSVRFRNIQHRVIPISAKLNNAARCKYTDTSKYKDFKGKHKAAAVQANPYGEVGLDELNLEDAVYDAVANSVMHVQTKLQSEQNVLIIQPYVKWGPKKSASQPEHQLQEAEALVRSVPKWSVEHGMMVALESLDKKHLFGSGKLDEIKSAIGAMRASGTSITCIFISKGTLKFGQKQFLEHYFKIPVMDRYSIVIQILRLHAFSTEAKLQVAMAEIPYIWSQVKEHEAGCSANRVYLTESQKQMLRQRERKLKNELTTIRSHRELLRNKRKQKAYPIVAVVGYTNAGKTSLIKALTGEKSLEPRDQLFATLDVTAHAGVLPCQLEVLFMDTVGFMSDIPTGLIECFVATLEDAMLADVIVHVQDVSHTNFVEQKKHVEHTLASLLRSSGVNELNSDNVINVGNKTDQLKDRSNLKLYADLHLVSSKTQIGINDLLLEIERKILKNTGRQKIVVRVPMGSQEVAWLYKNAAVTGTTADPQNNQQMLVNAIITDAKLQQFKHIFIKRSRNKI
ncbi:putative GTP-binding protein 6 [Toxorhynchites rutilus septentrionalis]|uniref:putative GTP-binding protein 6 n=1 Tax=Toxorhynchites rutilus septentrionalis TaxID=329112 RepID=UPI00247B2839|nr:putative GTP-binding protein 6 [Toxorhynchites rutilus septentrionalis]